jgi:hypothetical protein
MPKAIDLVGRQFGRLTVVCSAGVSQSKRPRKLWSCMCSCGNMVVRLGVSLSARHRHSCGCLESEAMTKRAVRAKDSPEYKSWAGAKQRCGNPNNPLYKNYGGRGIRMCERWFNSFDEFMSDMGSMQENCNSLDRIDVNGDYEPGNCRWATPLMQGQNTTRTVYLTHGGVTMSASEWSRATGVKLPTIYGRKKRGKADAVCLGMECG